MNVCITRGNFGPATHQEARRNFDEIYRRHADGKIVVMEAKYCWSQLKEWYNELNRHIWGSYGIESGA